MREKTVQDLIIEIKDKYGLSYRQIAALCGYSQGRISQVLRGSESGNPTYRLLNNLNFLSEFLEYRKESTVPVKKDINVLPLKERLNAVMGAVVDHCDDPEELKEHLLHVMATAASEKFEGNKVKASEYLGINRGSFRKYLNYQPQAFL